MTFTTVGAILLVVDLIYIFILYSIANIKSKTRLHKNFVTLIIFFIIHIFGLFLQTLFSNANVNPIYFEYIAYVGGMNFSTAIFILACSYYFKSSELKKLNGLYVIPIVLLIILWTNDLHHLFYREYSVYLNLSKFGPFLDFFTVYSYISLAGAFILMLLASIKRSGFISAQTFTILLGLLVPVIGNMIGVLGFVQTTVYVTPILLSATAVCFYVAVFKLKALSITPVTTKTILNSMTDAFVVISEDGTISDVNKTFIETFKPLKEITGKDNLFKLLKNSKKFDAKDIFDSIKECIAQRKTITKEFHIKAGDFDKYFDADFQPVLSRDKQDVVATLILIRDITVAKKDLEIMIKNENLVILGELAGGVAHDINTPISAIKSGVLMLKDTAKTDDEKMLLDSMDRCADKIVALTNSLRNQIRNIGSEVVSDIDISTILSDIKLILNNELKKNNATLNVEIKNNVILKGNPTKLSQVITNIVNNAVQAYEGRGGEVNVTLDEINNNAIVKVEDHANGIPEEIRPFIFKNILTTKGVSGTGFGLYLAYSVIKGAFGGEITFDTKTGVGTTFTITIPIKK